MIRIPTLADVLRPDRRVGRFTFIYGTGLLILGFWSVVRISQIGLPAMAEILSPRGINAAFVLNMIWLVAGLLLVWSLSALAANRLRDAGHWPWWGAVGIVPLAVLALLNDAIFLVSRSFVLPGWANGLALAVFGAIAVGVVFIGGVRGSVR